MTAVKHSDIVPDPAALVRAELGCYDARFLNYSDSLRRRLTAGTREVLAAWLTDEIRCRLPVGDRMRAFCVRHDLIDELARLISDEVAGRREGAVVVGGRVYAVYPYLRGVPRRDADITADVGVEQRLDAVWWTGDALRIRGHAAIERIAAREEHVELVLRERAAGAVLRIATEPGDEQHEGKHDEQHESEHDRMHGEAGAGFAASIPVAELSPGQWDVHVSVRALGLTRQAPLGAGKTTGLDACLPDRPEVTAYLTASGNLAIAIPGRARRLTRTWWRRLTRTGWRRPPAPS